ncbi:MAG: hypothetical protein K9N21_21035 [Deltaproteobacteria bacterium]|nr:hypothetical protein [Deltaproteobacteria bacterium]
MKNERGRSFWTPLLAVILGGLVSIATTAILQLWLIPAKEWKGHIRELQEQRLSKLYQPLTIATLDGQATIVSDVTFYRVWSIMNEYGYLAHPELMEKYLAFLRLCEFAGYEDLKEGSFHQRPPPDELVLEIVKEKHFPLKYTAERLEKLNVSAKEFQSELKKRYREAYIDFTKRLP